MSMDFYRGYYIGYTPYLAAAGKHYAVYSPTSKFSLGYFSSALGAKQFISRLNAGNV